MNSEGKNINGFYKNMHYITFLLKNYVIKVINNKIEIKFNNFSFIQLANNL